MAKTAGRRQPKRRKKLIPITGISRRIVDYVINAAVFGEYPDCCSLEDLAKEFKRQPTRLRTTIQRLVEAGYLTVRGALLEIVYPTTEALRNQDRNLSDAAARRIVRQLQAKR